MHLRTLLFLALIGFGALQHFQNREIVHGPGVMVQDAPLQKDLEDPEVETINGYSLTPLATFSIKARVLSIKNYHMGREADLSPIDLALGWGPMSDEAVLDKISISQGNRFYFWHVDAFPIPRKEIETNSANMHMIPATDSVKDVLKSARVGQVVQLEGYLIEARADDGWRWRSSLTRSDTGNGACEVVLVKKISVL
jgi:hypothetical protein